MERPFSCPKCGQKFALRQTLYRHEHRITPCDTKKEFSCACGKNYVRATSLYRHKRNCQYAKAQDNPEPAAAIQQKAMVAGAAPVMTRCTNCTMHVTQNVSINPFTEEPIVLSWDEVRAVFGGVPDLKSIPVEDAVRRVMDLLMEAVRAKHRDPRERNICLNASRTDFVKVYMPTDGGAGWVLRPLVEAVTILFVRIARGWCVTGKIENPAHRPEALKKQAIFAGELVARSPADYAERGKLPFTAMLYNEAAGCVPAPTGPPAPPARVAWTTTWPPPDCPTPFADCPIAVSWDVASGTFREVHPDLHDFGTRADEAPALIAGYVAALAEQAMAPRAEQRVMLNHDLGFVSVMEDRGWGMMRLDRAFEAICHKMGRDLSALQAVEGRDAAVLAQLRAVGATLEARPAACAAVARDGLIDVLGRLLDATPPARRAELHLP